jgi:hypothetical protein
VQAIIAITAIKTIPAVVTPQIKPAQNTNDLLRSSKQRVAI